MLRRTPLTPKRADGGNIGLEPLLLRPICPRRKLDERVQRDLHPRALLLRHIQVVGIDAPQHSLMRHNDDVLAAFELHDNGFEPNDNVAVRFPAPIAVIILVVVARLEVFRVAVRNVLVREAVADARVQFVQGLPLELVVALGRGGEEAGGLNGPFERRGPDGELAVVADGRGDEVGQRAGVELAALRDVGVAADFALEVELRFAVLNQC